MIVNDIPSQHINIEPREKNPECIEKDTKLQEKWEKMQLPACILEKHRDCAHFLFESGLLFNILGYQETCQDQEIHSIKLDWNEHPMIKKEGQFIRWERIKEDLTYHSATQKIQSEDGRIWNYFHPHGLVPLDRINYDKVFPIYQLSETEYDSLLILAYKFFDTNPEIEPQIPKDCVVQFFTSGRPVDGIPTGLLFQNIHRNWPIHIGVRLITQNGEVYSFGWQIKSAEDVPRIFSTFSHFFKTTEAKIGMLDFEEFGYHEGRIVTSIPISSKRADNILERIDALNHTHLTFQLGRLNCTVLMQEVMQQTGYEVDTRTTIGDCLWEILLPFNQFPAISSPLSKVHSFAQKIVKRCPQPIQWSKDAILYLPRKCGTALTNLIVLKMGGAEKLRTLPEEIEDEELDNKKWVQNFSSLIKKESSLFDPKISEISHVKFLIDWQKRQGSTFIEPKANRPRLAIVPKIE